MVIVLMGDFPSSYADGENHHGSSKTERLSARGGKSPLLLVQADAASRRGLIQSLGST